MTLSWWVSKGEEPKPRWFHITFQLSDTIDRAWLNGREVHHQWMILALANQCPITFSGRGMSVEHLRDKGVA